MVKIKISEIKMGNRHRKNLGDLSILAKSIENLGLLQPIGITKEKDLVFGERRIEAVKILGWEEIETKIIDIESLVDGEYAENEVRKDFSISERVAIGTTLEKKLGERRGRTEIEYSTEKVQNSAQLDGNVSISVEYATDSDASKTRDLASEFKFFLEIVLYRFHKYPNLLFLLSKSNLTCDRYRFHLQDCRIHLAFCCVLEGFQKEQLADLKF